MSDELWDVLQVTYAERPTTRSAMFDRFAESGEPDGPLLMDYNFWVLRRPGSVLLVDTGYDVAARPGFEEVETIRVLDALAALDIDASEVDGIILTHYHFDHIANVGLFPQARLYASAIEDAYWTRHQRLGIDAVIVRDEDLAQIEAARAEGRLTLFPGNHEVAPGVRVHAVPGHTDGQLVVIVAGRSGNVLLTSDAVHFYEQVELGWNFFVYADLAQMQHSYRTIRALAEDAGATIVPGHDARVRQRHPRSAGPYLTVLS
ncbi:N-acyl homoserine lactonase family protein [Microbacterium sp. F51-2R]|uniref:N-acyl homoserine lactonase family protein n=1 Tax=Microbacterium sp. F51-2R TaxID=3445777 RepID=UPI003F9EFE22